MNKTKIVIVGGGFGGIYTARYLERFFDEDSLEITLINKNNYFLFTPLLHEVATGALTPESVVEPIREIFRGGPVHFTEAIVTEVKPEEKKVVTTCATYDYDYLVVSAGAETAYFGVPGAQENSFTLKNLSDAVTLRNHFISTFEKAFATNNKDLLTFAVIGAGATGVELASELIEYAEHTLTSYYKNSPFTTKDIKISLITATPDLLSVFPPEMRTIALDEMTKKGITPVFNAQAVKVEPGVITLKDGTTVKANTIIWVAGVTPSLSSIKGIEVGPKKRIEVNEYLQTLKYPNIFALGDAGGSFPMLAQVATRQAKVVAKNIGALSEKTPLIPFSFKQNIILVSLGQWSAAGHFWKYTLRGPVMWWLWRTIYLFNFLSWRKKAEIVVEWTTNLFYPRNITYIK